MEISIWNNWWTYDPAEAGFAQVYHGFNLVEGLAWCVVATLIVVRFSQYRKSFVEVVYAASFATFGWSDFREAHSLDSWLILLKGANLAIILLLRRHVLRRFYPQSHTF